jgi:ribosome-binding protein aMBF1 (putative translation factor)
MAGQSRQVRSRRSLLRLDGAARLPGTTARPSRGDAPAERTAGELLRETRRRHGLTQRQLAARARTSQAAISRIERGLVSPTVDMLARLLWMMNEQLVLEAEGG